LNRKIIGIIICFFIFSLNSVNSIKENKGDIQNKQLNESIFIDVNSNNGILKLNNGFLHGRDENSPNLNETLINALKPEEWRLYKANSYAIATRHNANITYGLSDHYGWNQGGFPNANPWENWSYYETFILYVMQYYDNYFPDYPVEYYDIWNEPDHPYFWHGTYEQLLELFYRTYNIIKSYNPNAKVVGPSISWFRPGYPGVKGIIDFLVDLDKIYGVRLDAISWHENGGIWADTKPEDIPYRAQYLRLKIQENFPSDYNPELHVNEYIGAQVHLSPGWNVGFLKYLEVANVDKAMRACWYTYSLDPYTYCSDCWYGLNGMFMSDGQTPQRAYWVQYTHSQMEGNIKLDVVDSNENTNAIVVRNVTSNQIQILLGRYFKNFPGDVSIFIGNYSFYKDEVHVKIEIVPNDPTFYNDPPQMIPMPDGPILLSNDTIQINNDEISLLLANVEDGDAYIITIIPDNLPPNKPKIDGPISGRKSVNYEYTFNSIDLDDDDVQFYIEWGNNNEWTDLIGSGEDIILNHKWNNPNNYTIRAKTIDINGLESYWSYLEVTMPKSINEFNHLIFRLIQRFPFLEFLL
jgi:hypothetical protein